MFIPPTSSHHCHHLAHAAFRMHHISCVLLGGAYRHAAALVGERGRTTVTAPLLAGLGRFSGLRLGRESLDLGRMEWISRVVERTPLVVTRADRPVPQKRGRQQLGRGQGPSHFQRRPCARGHGHPPPDGFDPPVSFQPQRHITMILGRPVMVHMWSKNIRAIL